ncbi:hypothetical protein LEP1GSC188_4788 [Leptospira weilii serovar Topaz str. LT2116]|uniref:Uncharacterized protein n=1 Tax=Leptospira weilii serovar Topaz str. LT2116 TaxID=1088540 RepID=M3GZS9_9LEPT|nr:hypothetical protein LEP1GSC188_4788 [Leptospira weilii serovar Topaz str. LT2116]
MSKILRLNVGFVFKLTVLYFIGISKAKQPFYKERRPIKSQKKLTK